VVVQRAHFISHEKLDATPSPSHDHGTVRRDLPAGTVTFLFSDVEGSTKLLHELGAEAYAEKLAEHRSVVRKACTARDGVEVDTQGDAFFIVFPTAPQAAEAAQAITDELASGLIALRIGLHTGTPLLTEEGYVGEDVHIAARVAASAHGGQVVLSQAIRALIEARCALVDLGEHRLKDIPEPVAIYQLGDGQFPPLKTISNTNLPRPASSFVGRERELQDVLARIGDGARLVTLTGPGGSGKTRLALEAAATLVPEYKAGVFWVGLAALRDPALVTETIAQTLGAKDGLAEFIGEREMLLLVDNFEQVIDAASELSSLLQGCPNLTLIVTSRELVRVQGEVEYSVPPLAAAEAVSLFCQRAQTEPSEEISELCRRLDSLPLAVELAAARTKLLSPAEILDRLSLRLDLFRGGRDADARQQTLRATIAWSYDLLSEEEQQLFRRLSVFSGGCTLEAAEEICNADLDTLESLLDKSLLRRTGQRFWMLETIREFAAGGLERSPERAAVRDLHMRWYAAELSQRELAVRDHDVDAVAFVETELDNARVALTHALGHEEATVAVHLIWGTYVTWLLTGRAVEGAHFAEAVLAADLPVAGVDRVCLLGATGELLRMTGDFERARQLKEAALAVARPLIGETLPGGRTIDAMLVSFQCDLADLALTRGEIAAADELSTTALAAARRGTDARALSRALGSAMWTAFEAGDTEQSMTLASECLGLDTGADRAVDAADDLVLRSLCRLRLQDIGGSGEDVADAIATVRAHPGRSPVMPSLLIAAGQLALALGRQGDARDLARLAAKTVRDQGAVLAPSESQLLREIQIRHSLAPKVEEDVALLTEDEALDLATTIAASAHEDKTADAIP
jgi:predicted ATPase/class 3 adenylate cyclase